MLTQLLNHIDLYLILRCTMRDLETWLVSNLQRILDSGDSQAVEVANRVDADLIELGEALIDEVTLRERFASYVMIYNTVPISFFETERTTSDHATTATKTFSHRLVVPGLVESYPVDLVFA